MAASRVASQAQLSQRLSTIAGKWVQDPFRHIQLSAFLESLAKHPRLTPQAVEAASALQNNIVFKKVRFSREPRFPIGLNTGLFLLVSIVTENLGARFGTAALFTAC
ncbi:uncharacterized protein ARMOST_11742 [Armillaria ostoyae]|uniref:Uncharacterized protein n=1 Tax=Armillaria ostoyae TaxID=47428 RepID=A0A284RHZ6_ARMOS|nr:uncharacterized protein ARMOST_11742 [Armillaria ostoyae]